MPPTTTANHAQRGEQPYVEEASKQAQFKRAKQQNTHLLAFAFQPEANRTLIVARERGDTKRVDWDIVCIPGNFFPPPSILQFGPIIVPQMQILPQPSQSLWLDSRTAFPLHISVPANTFILILILNASDFFSFFEAEAVELGWRVLGRLSPPAPS